MTKKCVEIITDRMGKKVAVIKNILFRGRRNIDWKAVENYLEQYVGTQILIKKTGECILIDSDFPDEYTGSIYTYALRGALAKAKANASQGILEMIEVAEFKCTIENKSKKHLLDAKNGWRYYETRFALPVCGTNGRIVRYNTYKSTLVVRCSNNKRLYLYDIVEIKKETSNPLEP